MGWGWHSASEHSIHSVVATAGHRTAAESERERERLYSESGPGNVWSLEARQSEWAQHSLGRSRRQEAAQRLGLAWHWPLWPRLARSHTTTVALEISSEQLSAGPCDQYYPILRRQETGVNMWPQGGLRHTAWRGCVTQSDGVTVIGECQEQCFFLSFITQQGQCYFPFVQRVSTGQGS